MRHNTSKPNDIAGSSSDNLTNSDHLANKEMALASNVAETAQALTREGKAVEAGQQKEGTLTKRIENVTTRFSSGTFLGLALGSVALSAILQGMGRKQNAQFVGQWVPTILILGLYNKLVKVEGSE